MQQHTRFRRDHSSRSRQQDIEADHQHLVHCLNRLQAQLDQGREPLHEDFNDLLQHAYAHFNKEEAHMLQAGYPAAADHARRHEEILVKLIEMSADLMHGGAKTVQRVCAQILELADQHMHVDDKQLADYVKSLA